MELDGFYRWLVNHQVVTMANEQQTEFVTSSDSKIGEPVDSIHQASVNGTNERRGSSISGLSNLSLDDNRTRMCTQASFAGAVILTLLVAGYLLLGGFVFWEMEGSNQEERQSVVNNRRAAIIDDVITQLVSSGSITLTNSTLANVTYLLDESFLEYHGLLFSECSGGTLTPGVDIAVKWEFFTGYVLALTIITTIGYGHILPRSSRGQVFCMFYAIIGIPLFLLFLGNLGTCIATWVRARARTWLRYYYKCKSNRRKRRPSNCVAISMQSRGENWILKENESIQDPEDRRNIGTQVGDPAEAGLNQGTDVKEPEVNRIRAVAPWVLEDEVSELSDREGVDSERQDLTAKNMSNNNRNENLSSMSEQMQPVTGRKIPETQQSTAVVSQRASSNRSRGGYKSSLEEEEETLSFLILIVLFLVYVFSVSLIVQVTEPDWTYLECIYFCVVTITTIGFGDYVLTRGSTDLDKYLKPLLVAFFIIIGLMILSALFNTAQGGMKALGSRLSSLVKRCLCKPCRKKDKSKENI
ncbi:uncharacterized protein [Ptychodera flava]|uniref:uncharacterized protein n=1 Tax=Ptychodera flava TaxID=63121 RepID=UPI00396A6063